MNPARWSVRNRVAVNLLTVVILATGLFLGTAKVPRSLFPDIAWNYISIGVLDRSNGLPEDIERLVTIPIEESLASVKHIKELTSISQPNFASIWMQVEAGEDAEPVLNDIRQEVARIRSRLPLTIEEPVIELFDAPFPLFGLGVTLPPGVEARELRPQLDRLERELRLVRGVSRVNVDGLERREVWIEIDPVRAEAHGVSPAAVLAAVQAANLDTAAGRERGVGGERVVRVIAQAQRASDFETMPVGVGTEGSTVLVRDVATVRETAEEARSRARVNLRPGVGFTVFRQQGADARVVAAGVRAVIAAVEPSLPAGAKILVLSDATQPIDIRLETVITNGLQALLIISLLLMVFLNWRLALIVSIGLPVSVAGVFIVLHVTGGTIDVLSLFAIIMALGMLVDDALVISENVYRLFEQGVPPLQAAIQGTGEVIVPVLGSVATTVAAFLPLLLGEGIIGRILFIVPVVVVAALVVSLIQAFFVLPSHLADFVRHPPTIAELEARLAAARGRRRLVPWIALVYWETRHVFDALLDRVREVYLFLLKACLRRRYAVVGGFCLSIVACGILLASPIIPFQLFDADYADRLFIKLDLPASASLDQTGDAVAAVERAIVDRLPPDDVRAVLSQVGRRLNDADEYELIGSNVAMITVDLDEQNPRARPASVIERDLQRMLLDFPQFIRASARKEEGGPPVGRAVNVIIAGEEFATLRTIADEVKRRLGEVGGVTNTADDFDPGTPEWRLILDRERVARAGLDAREIGLLVGTSYAGVEANRMRWDDDEVIVRVRSTERLSRDPERMLGLRLVSRDGRVVPVQDVARLELGSGLARVFRRNQSRTITVSADVDPRVITSVEINQQLGTWLPEILKAHPGYSFRLAGENEDTAESLEAMGLASLLAIALIYTILAVLFNSFAQPLIVMAVIPFGIVGVVLGLLFQGQSMGLMSILGTIALAGIVVNNSVVFLDFMNQFRLKNPLIKPGDPGLKHYRFDRWYSILDAGKVRLRPIFLTTVTTVAGLWSIAFFSTGQEQFLAPMAQALVWGLSFATMITLVLIPCLYAILDDFVLWNHRRRLRRASGSAGVPTALARPSAP
jgi:multidrug efflux pump subunit AcrB